MACCYIPKKYFALIICLLLGSFAMAGAASSPVATNAAGVATKGAPTGSGTTASLTIITTSLPPGTYGVPYSAMVSATGGTPPYTWLVSGASIAHPGLPAGLQLTSSASPSSGLLSGTPTVVGSYPLIVMVHDHAGGAASKPLVLTLSYAQLTITTGGLPPAVVNVRYSATLAAGGGRAPYVWSRVSGSLPVGLTMTAAGAISGTPTTLGASNFVVSVTDSEAPPVSTRASFSISVSSARDIYGGITTLPSPGGASGFFRLELAVKGNVQREMLVSPLGNYFYMQSVFDAEPGYIESGVLQSRYGGDRNLWATHAHNRMLNWGFNTLDIYTAATGLPVGTYGGSTGNTVKLPFVLLFAASPDIYLNPQRVPGQVDPIKNITVGVPSSTYNGWQGRLLDVFSPQWQAAYTFEVGNNNSMITGGFASTPWIVGATLEDADYFWALKGVGTCPNGATYPHPTYLIATTMFSYTAAQSNLGRAYQDTKLYSKYAWVNYLRNKYGNIAALNSAWHSSYTSFDDNGGYGTGTGVLDEDGRHAWMGRDWNNLSDESAGLQADMNGFLYQYVYQGWSVAARTVRNNDPNHLLFGPSAIGGIGQCGVRPQVMQALKDAGIQAVAMNYDPRNPATIAANNALYDQSGLPQLIWYTVTANPDSYWHGRAGDWNNQDSATQQQRGQHYASDQQVFYNAAGLNGIHYIVGVEWWSITDSGTAETSNFGLISDKDNAYDGRCAVVAPTTDSWGYPCGGEAANYGNFLDSVTQANSGTVQQIITDLGGTRGPTL